MEHAVLVVVHRDRPDQSRNGRGAEVELRVWMGCQRGDQDVGVK